MKDTIIKIVNQNKTRSCERIIVYYLLQTLQFYELKRISRYKSEVTWIRLKYSDIQRGMRVCRVGQYTISNFVAEALEVNTPNSNPNFHILSIVSSKTK